MLLLCKNVSTSGWEAEYTKTFPLQLHQLTSIVEETIFQLTRWGTTQYTKHWYRNLHKLQVYLQILHHPTLKKKTLLTGKVKQSNNGSNLVRNHWVLRNTSASSEHTGLKSALGKCSFFWTIMPCMLALIFTINWSDKLTISFCPTSESNQTDPSPSWLVSLQVLISKQTNL